MQRDVALGKERDGYHLKAIFPLSYLRKGTSIVILAHLIDSNQEEGERK